MEAGTVTNYNRTQVYPRTVLDKADCVVTAATRHRGLPWATLSTSRSILSDSKLALLGWTGKGPGF